MNVDQVEALLEAIARAVVAELARISNSPIVGMRPAGAVYRVGPLVVDTGRYEASVNDRPMQLKHREFVLLAELARNAGLALSRDRILELAWPDDKSEGIDNERTVDVHVRRIRKALGEHSDWLQTVHGVGYRLRDR